jgi:DNA-binding CsgD family transcriptional regulator
MPRSPSAHALADLAHIAAAATPRAGFRAEVLARLERAVGFDVGVLWRVDTGRPSDSTIVGFEPRYFELYCARRDTYEPDLAPLLAAARDAPAADRDVFALRERERHAFYAEIVRPIGTRFFVTALVRVGERTLGVLQLGRTGKVAPDFRAAALATLRDAMPIVSLGEAARDARVGVRPDLPLSPRERDVAEYAALGLTAGEIAAALGTSRNTVRNQLAGLYRKVGASTRGELVGILLRGPPR